MFGCCIWVAGAGGCRALGLGFSVLGTMLLHVLVAV